MALARPQLSVDEDGETFDVRNFGADHFCSSGIWTNAIFSTKITPRTMLTDYVLVGVIELTLFFQTRLQLALAF
jgi:hypothetical protein